MIQNKKWIVAFIGAVSLAALGFSAGIPGQASAEETMNVYTEPSPFAVVADKAMPATVFIKTVIEAPQQQYLNPFEMFGDDFFHRFFGQQFGRGQQQPQQQQQRRRLQEERHASSTKVLPTAPGTTTASP